MRVVVPRCKMYLFALVGGLVSAVAFAASDPLESLKTFSDFRSINLERLLEGEILSERGSLMDSPDGICAQTCFVVPVTAREAIKRLRTWDPSSHEALKVFAFHPMRVPCHAKDFQSLGLDFNQYGFRWLLDKTLATTAGKSELNLTHAEARRLADCAQNHSDPQTVGTCWADLLRQRVTAFQDKGFAGVTPYEANGATVSPTEQLRSILREQTAVAREFAALLRQSGVLDTLPSATLTPLPYWGLYEANHRTMLNLGAIYVLPVEDHYQLMDVEYYVSGSYNCAITLSEIWPIRIGDKSVALVWRGDFLSARRLALVKGADRIAYGVMMVQEIKKVVRCFQDDLRGK